MNDNKPKEIFLKDYCRPDYLITHIKLTVDLHDTKTKVCSLLNIERNGGVKKESVPLVLNGEGLKLQSIKLNDLSLPSTDYQLAEENLIIKNVPDKFTLEIITAINPLENKALEGLYKSGDIFCTQCEAEGFRKITYYLDRPDNMASFTTKIIAEKNKYPVLLSNGNPINSGDLEGGKHFVEWHDPFLKPCYLFALVAGDLGLVSDKFTTRSEREIDLRIYCDKGNESQCGHAMESLKKAMKWDEDVFDLEYDLDIFMIVAVDSFNMGAMENKGLNIFNSAYILADPKSATDNDFLRIESVVAHEYFHNWTGNRITCRDWFQLTLKEGLTVFRDQQFSGDMNSKVVQRINDVETLRAAQFPEDAGPTAHPIRPESYIKMDNFYTATVYEKGAEVIRMVHTLLGDIGFRRGISKYFELFDGQAVTIEDFLHAMSKANNDYDFSQFKLWYSQIGTPSISVDYKFDPEKRTLSLKVLQESSKSSEKERDKPLHIPFNIGLIDKNGKEIELKLTSDQKSLHPKLNEGILNIKKDEETFIFNEVDNFGTVSLNRNFSGPLLVNSSQNFDDLIFLMSNDTDNFNRYEASQDIAKSILLDLVKRHQNNEKFEIDDGYSKAFGALLKDGSLDNSFKALSLELPAQEIIHQQMNEIDYHAVYHARKFLKRYLAHKYRDDFLRLYTELCMAKGFSLDNKSMGERSLKNCALSYLMTLEDKEVHHICYQQFKQATNMTDEMSAFSYLYFNETPFREEVNQTFYNKWKDVNLVIQKWFAVNAGSPLEDTYDRVNMLLSDPVYDKTIPNHVRCLVGLFGKNYINFHHSTGRGHKFMADRILEMDKINPHMSAGLMQLFRDYSRLMPENKRSMEKELNRIRKHSDLSSNVFEIVNKILTV